MKEIVGKNIHKNVGLFNLSQYYQLQVYPLPGPARWGHSEKAPLLHHNNNYLHNNSNNNQNNSNPD